MNKQHLESEEEELFSIPKHKNPRNNYNFFYHTRSESDICKNHFGFGTPTLCKDNAYNSFDSILVLVFFIRITKYVILYGLEFFGFL